LAYEYAMDARTAEQAPRLYANRRKAVVGVFLGVVGGYALGVPTSFVRRRGSLPWEPFDMVIAGSIWAAVFTVFTVLILVLMHRYVSLFQTGARVASLVTNEQERMGQRGVVVQFTDVAGESHYSWVFPSSLAVGTRTSTIVGPQGSRLVLNQNGGKYTRGSALTMDQVKQILG
jgi:hypothetical protein